MATFTITTPVPDLPFEMRQTFAGEFLFVKNKYVAYILDGTSATIISDRQYPSYHFYTLTSLTRSGTTATATTAVNHELATGMSVTIAGADQAAYNGTFTITVTGLDTFTYTVAGAPATPATGTITAYGGWTTVPGIVYLNDYIVVGRSDGEIHSCTRSSYTVWTGLDFFVPEMEPSLLVRIAKILNFIFVAKQWDTEIWYDAEQEPPGSPFLQNESAYTKLGCAAAYSLAEFDGGLVMMTKRDQNQRSREIHIWEGLTPRKISTPAVERIINASDLSDVKALYLSTAGHQLYVLTLIDIEKTLVCDLGNGFWYEWTKLTAQSSKNVLGISREGNTATVLLVDHGYGDGDPVTIAGATPSAYNGTFNITYIDENTFSYQVEGSPTSPATGSITAVGYTESYFPAVAYATYQNLDLVLDQSTGTIYSLRAEFYEDTNVPINVILRLPPWDNGNKDRKTFSHIRPVGDLVDSNILVRYNDEDYDPDEWSQYRRCAMESNAPMVRKLGQGRRRAWEFRHTADTAMVMEAADQDFRQGF